MGDRCEESLFGEWRVFGPWHGVQRTLDPITTHLERALIGEHETSCGGIELLQFHPVLQADFYLDNHLPVAQLVAGAIRKRDEELYLRLGVCGFDAEVDSSQSYDEKNSSDHNRRNETRFHVHDFSLPQIPEVQVANDSQFRKELNL
jgi:hypothetical protein